MNDPSLDTERSVRVITNALPIMNILAGTETVSLYTIGGSFRREAGSFVGPLSLLSYPLTPGGQQRLQF